MNILIVTQHFPPEKGAVRRLFEFARYFVRQGESVSVMTAIPNYPDGVVPEKYRGHFFYAEEMDGVKVYRSYVLPAANRFPGKRMIGFVIFLVTALINSFRIKGPFDLVLASSPPVTSLVIGWTLSKLKRAKYIVEVRDPQPECSEQFGNLRRSVFTSVIRRIVHALYHRADRVVAVSDGFAQHILNGGVDPSKIAIVKSGVSAEFFETDSNGIRKSFGWEEKFLVVYAGTLGWAHALETIIEAARQLVDQPSIQFVFVGDGQKRGVLEGMVRDYGLKNVSFIGLQPLESIPRFLNASDVLVESVKEVPVSRGTFPSKLYEYMASGRPIIYGSCSGEAVRELNKAGGALWFPTDDPVRLSSLIRKLRSGEIDGNGLGMSYQQHVAQHHRRELWASRYLSLIREV
ncbi:MAG TPA: glycosyltransferase family 4 protein [Candidatus Deferrimicrobium sp.]|nr:glycosyltransferase family 4 protein [Candidatus Deferrimicrobium sp.]